MSQTFHTALLLLGANQGNKKLQLQKAICSISNNCGKIVTQSGLYFSESWGYYDENYLNQAIKINTSHSPQELLSETQLIEKQLGRTSKTTHNYQSRPIDIDILFYDAIIIQSSNLAIPHPRLHLRNFALQPLMEIAPDFIHPILCKTITKLATNCPDTGKVWQ